MYSRRFSPIAMLAVFMLLVGACSGGDSTPAPDNSDDAGQTTIPTPTPAAEIEMEDEPTEKSEERIEADPAVPTHAPEDAMTAEGGELPAVDPSDYSEPIVTAGSSTVFPLTEAMAERFQDEGYAGNITVDSIGSGAGFERFCVAGETDISNASRPIKGEEVESCQEIGREPIEFRVATDALAVVVNPENDWVDSVTLDELRQLFSSEAELWSDVNQEWPDEPIQRFSPGTDSGTYDYFIEAVMEENEEPLLNTSNLQLSEDDNVLAQGVIGSPNAIGYFGYAYYEENQESLKALSIDGVEPSGESVDAGTYSLARPLFIYSTAEIMQEKPQVAGFINFYLQHAGEEALEVGYFPASDAAYETARENWLMAMGEMEGDPTVAARRSQ